MNLRLPQNIISNFTFTKKLISEIWLKKGTAVIHICTKLNENSHYISIETMHNEPTTEKTRMLNKIILQHINWNY